MRYAIAILTVLVFGGSATAQAPFPTPQSPPAPFKAPPLPTKAPGFAAPSAQFGGSGSYDPNDDPVGIGPMPSYATTTTVTVLRSAPVVVTRSYGAASYGTSAGCRQQNFGAGVYAAGGCNAPAVNPNFGASYGYGGSFGGGRVRPNRGIPGASGVLGLPGRILRGPRTN